MDMPERIKKRPQFRGLPIPYTTFVGPDGQPDFKVVDNRKIQACLQRNLCGVCGETLGDVIVFIGGDLCVQHRHFIDPGMHKICALYAASMCPYLSNSQWDYSTRDPKHLGDDQTVIRTYEHVNPHRPWRLALYYCKRYEMVFVNDAWHAKAGKPIRVDWSVMPETERP